ncbi:OprD family porin [Pseudomonas sp. Marseille-QA0892]
MQVMKWSVMALAVAAGTTQMAMASAQSESKGFVDDSSLNVLNRNYYMNRDFRSAGGNGGQSYREEWGHGLITTFESGFTQGTIGFGVDAHGLVGLKLDSGNGRAGNGLFPNEFGDSGPDDYAKAGAAVKLRASNTVLKYGTQFTSLPVFATDDSRLLPESAEGFLITSNEIEGLELNAGHFTALNAQRFTHHDSIGLKSANVLGGTYQFNDGLAASVYYSDLDDLFKKWYGNVNYSLPLSDSQALAFDFNVYRTKYDSDFTTTGSSERNTIGSLSAAYSIDAHTFTLAYQRSKGGFDGTGYYYNEDGNATIFLANSVQYSDFNAEDEKSWQVRYDLNMAGYGVPGLSFMTRYVRGTDIKIADASDATEREWDIEAKYVIQNGPAKDLSFRARQAFYRTNTSYGGDVNDFRLIVEYPLSIL